MKVRDLLAALRECPPDAEVLTEGCDCHGDVASLELYGPGRRRPAGALFLRRTQDRYGRPDGGVLGATQDGPLLRAFVEQP